jgi:dUTP pyrophosphatase
MRIAVKKLVSDAQLPKYAKEGDAGADICSVEDTTLWSGEYKAISTGLSIEPESFCEVQCRSRSGLAAKNGVAVLNSPGTIDFGYRGEIKVILINHGKEPFRVEKGMRIAQLVVNPLCQAEFYEAVQLGVSERGDGGFGSTGVK